LVKRAFNALGLFDFARVDLRMDRDGNMYILEVNSMASLGLTGTYVHAAKVAGYSYDQLINRMLDVAAVRYFGQAYAAAAAGTSEIEKKPQKLSYRVRSYLRSQAPTPPDEVERVNAFGEWITGQFRQIGFSATVFPQLEAGNVLHFQNHEGAVCDVLLLSHLDCAAPPGGYVEYRAEGNHLYGTGIAESKGGLAVALTALRALRFARTVRRIRCGVLLTSDDTVNGTAGRSIVERVTTNSRHVVGLKAGSDEGGIVLSRSGRATYRLEAVYPKKRTVTEAEALSHLFRRATALEALSDPDAGLRVAIRRVEFDAPFDRTPEKAEATVTVRFNDIAQGLHVEERIREIARKRSAKGIRLQVSGRIRRPAMRHSEASEAFFQEVAAIAQRQNQPIRSVHRWHSSDICFVADSIPAIDGMGPVGAQERTQGEHIVRSSLADRAALLAMVIHHCAKNQAR
jgi:D-alanine-D-alanine ligase